MFCNGTPPRVVGLHSQLIAAPVEGSQCGSAAVFALTAGLAVMVGDFTSIDAQEEKVGKKGKNKKKADPPFYGAFGEDRPARRGPRTRLRPLRRKTPPRSRK